ncbi:MAG: tetratricopeptide repeat protein, partial [Candidatus Aureabacteria bacterium]|nr:tetratricopeptide repeat protein [Candidatus Auribacterota bacterium]
MARRDRYDRRPEDKFVSTAFNLMDTVMLHKTLCTALLIIIAGAAFGGFAYWNHLQTYNENALAAYDTARTADELSNIIQSYPGSEAEPLALFSKGKKLIEAKQYAAAAGVFNTLIAEHPRHSLAPNAMLFTGMLLEQEKKFDEAASRYGELIQRYPHSVVAPLGMLAMGGCYERINKGAEARAAYEKLVAAYPSSTWKSDA